MRMRSVYRHTTRALLALALGGIASGSVLADQININASKDNTLYSESDDLSDGAGEHLFAGNTGAGATRRALIAFDIAAVIPAGSTINSVTLMLRMSRTQAGDEMVSLHRVTSDWGEGASVAPGMEGEGGTAAEDDATWRYTFYDVSDPSSSPQWNALGGDFSATASASITVGGNGFYTWGSTATMVSDVQAWLDNPAASYGWILIGNEGVSSTAKRFESRQNTNTARRPVLTVDFTPPASTGACCFADGACLILSDTNCTTQGGTYQGDGTGCSPNPCPQPTGACCFVDGTCLELTSADCAAQSGFYQGDATTCSPNPCTPITGACCFDSGVCQELTESDCAAQAGIYQGDGTLCMPDLCPVILEPFVDPLPLPAVATPVTGTAGGEATYDIDMTQFEQQLHRDLPATTVWAYNGTYPGPTIEAGRDLPVTVNWINDLRDSGGQLRTTHYLDVDLCPHGAADNARTVVHLHGGHVPAEFDGYPEATFLPGNSVTYVYPNNQLPATLWYHDHALGVTRLNVYMGLAGFYLIRDAVELGLDLPAGQYEVPLVMQDRSFNSDGSWRYPSVWQEHFFGDTMLVNGKVWPFFNVDQGKYRLRLLNGCNSRTLTLSLSPPASFAQIGSDGGLLPAPVTLSEITLGPAERADVIVDFAQFSAGTEVLLVNSAPAPYPGTPGVGVIPDVMKFVVQSDSGETDPLPATLRPLETLDPNVARADRQLILRRESEPCAGSVWLINGLLWDDITEFPRLGSTEVWSFVNRSGISHPMHMHLVMFQVLDRQDFDVVDGEIVPVGALVPPPPNEAGWKDTVMANPGQITRVIARFDNYLGLYPYHCHILEHEDHEMMRQFRVVLPGDIDGDGDVDATDANAFFDCMNGPDVPYPAGCADADLDDDGDTDLLDAADIQVNFTGM